MDTSLKKKLAFCAAALGIFEGVIIGAFSLVAVLNYNNVYRINIDLGDIYYQVFIDDSGSDSPDLNITAKEFHIFTNFYVVLNVLWLLTSLYMLWGLSKGNFDSLHYIYATWATIALCQSLIDLILMSMMANDMVKWDITDGTLFFTTYIFFISFAAKFYIFWILNVVLAAILIQTTIELTKNSKRTTQQPLYNAYDTSNRFPVDDLSPYYGDISHKTPSTYTSNSFYGPPIQNQDISVKSKSFEALDKIDNNEYYLSNRIPRPPTSLPPGQVATINRPGRRSPPKNDLYQEYQQPVYNNSNTLPLNPNNFYLKKPVPPPKRPPAPPENSQYDNMRKPIGDPRSAVQNNPYKNVPPNQQLPYLDDYYPEIPEPDYDMEPDNKNMKSNLKTTSNYVY